MAHDNKETEDSQSEPALMGRAGKTFQGTEQQLRAALVAAEAGIWHWDLHANKQILDRSLLRLMGLPMEHWEGTFEDFLQLIVPDDRERVAAAFASSATKGIGLNTDFRVVRPDGEVRWLCDKGQVFTDVAGQPQFLVGACFDITERKRVNEQLRQGEARIRLLIELMPTGVYTCDAEGRINFFNQQAARILGREPKLDSDDERFSAGVRLRHVDGRFMPANESPAALAVLNQQSIRNMEMVIEHSDGDRATVLFSAEPLRNGSGRCIGAVIVFDDITERKQTEVKLQEANRRKDEFIATLSHELRNPLAPIQNSIAIIKMESNGGGGNAELLEIMDRQVKNLVHLVDDLLEVSRISRGKIQLHKEVVDIAVPVQTAVDTSRPLINAAGHQLIVSLPDAPLRTEVDPLRLSQIVSNLLSNAAKYTKAGGQIELTVAQEKNSIVISVKDTGIGITKEMLPRVFEMFVQSDREHNPARGGLGIGLSLVKQLVKLHGGRIEVKSAGPNKGSDFTVWIPLSDRGRSETTKTPLEQELPKPTKHRILVVDDNADAARSVGMLLSTLGNDVEIATDGLSAIQRVESFHPEILLLDLGMPEMSGFEVAHRIRQRPEFNDVKLIALTGWGQEEDRRRTKEAGFDDHLVKPLTVNRINQLLA